MMLGNCVNCSPMMGMSGMRGLGAVVMEPLTGGLAQGANAAGEMIAGLGPVAPAGVMLSAGLYGGALAGASAGSWKAAGTGALISSGLAGLGAGLGTLFLASTPEAAPVMEAPVAGLDASRMVGAAYVLIGAGLLGWGGFRAYKAMRKR